MVYTTDYTVSTIDFNIIICQNPDLKLNSKHVDVGHVAPGFVPTAQSGALTSTHEARPGDWAAVRMGKVDVFLGKNAA